MGTASRYCPKCNRFIEDAAGKCSICGAELRTSAKPQYFVSGPYQRGGPVANIEPGTRLSDRFTVIRRLGHGNGSAVYLARDAIRSADVALKIVEVGPCTEDTAAVQLQHEMAMHERVADHRHVIRVYDMHFVPTGNTGLLLLSMEYADGGTLRKWLLERKDDLECRRTEGLGYFREACRGVGAMHQAGAVHLDLKPENLLFVNGVLKVSDFGLALIAQSLQTATGVVWDRFSAYPGTPAYMSPEHFLAPHFDDLDARSDIYSLGVILFEILDPKCRPPFGGSYERLRDLHLRVPPPPLVEADENTMRVIARCLDKTPANRFPDVWTLLDDLEGRGDGIDPSQKPAEGPDADRLWEQTRWHAAAGDYRKAMRCCAELLRICPEHVEARRLSEELRIRYEQADQIYKIIESASDGRSLTERVTLLQEAIAIFPDHPVGRVTQVDVAVRAGTYRQCMEAGRQAALDGLWDTALAQFQQAQQLDPLGTGTAHAMEFISGVRDHVMELRRRINEAIQDRDRDRAMALAGAADEYMAQIRRLIGESHDVGGTERRATG